MKRSYFLETCAADLGKVLLVGAAAGAALLTLAPLAKAGMESAPVIRQTFTVTEQAPQVGVGRVVEPIIVEPVTVSVSDEAPADQVLTGADGITATSAELDLLAEIVWLEGRGESVQCQRDIASVVLNRVKSGLWGGSITEVIFAPGEFETARMLADAEPDPAIRDMVDELFRDGAELPARIMWFRAGWYHGWYGAVDEFSRDNTYFSSSMWAEVGE